MEVSYYVKVIVDRENHAVYFSTTDFHSFILVNFGDVSLSPLDDVPEEFLIRFKPLHDLIKCSTTEDVRLVNGKRKDHIKVTTNGDYEFPTYKEISQFMTADFSFDPIGQWDVPELINIWEKVSTVVSRDVTKASYQGVNFDGNWAASDNRRFAIMRGDDEHQYDGESMLIPIVFGEILSRCSGTVTFGRGSGGGMVVLSNPESGIVAAIRLLDAKFVNYNKVLDSRKPYIRMVMPKEYLLGVLQRMSCFTDKLFKVGIFSILRGEEGASIRCQIEHDATGDEELEATDFEMDQTLPQEGELVSFQYQVDNLATGISVVDSPDEVSISFLEDGKLWIDEGRFSYLLSRINA